MMALRINSRKQFKQNRLIVLALFITAKLFSQNIDAPIDYRSTDKEFFKLEYEFGNEYNSKLPTVIVVADAQQFYVRKGRIKKIQDELFGSEFNVLGIIPRSFNESLFEKIDVVTNNSTNWELAYTVFRSFQFVNDINQVINKVLSASNEIYLYGQSGGALLITEYLSAFPNTKVSKVFIGAGVNPVIEKQLGLNHDNFERDFLDGNKVARQQLTQVLEDNYFEREIVAQLVQRQNFFVEPSELSSERLKLIERLYEKDTSYINTCKEKYQINALREYIASKNGIPIRVRIAEFINPLIEKLYKTSDQFYPDIENSRYTALPVLEASLENKFQIEEGFDESSIRIYEGKVFILSGRYDHIADYRTSIYLHGLLPKSHLFIANDDHTFKGLKASKNYSKLIKNFFAFTDQKWMEDFKQFKWTEG